MQLINNNIVLSLYLPNICALSPIINIRHSSMEAKYLQLQTTMANALGLQVNQLTPVQATIILAHLINTQFGLQCVDRQGAKIEYPADWAFGTEGVYKFNYKIGNKDAKNEGKIVQFRFVDNQQTDGAVSVNYTIEDSDQLHQYELRVQKDKVSDAAKNYRKSLEQKLLKKPAGQQAQQPQEPRRLQPVFREPPNYDRPVQPMAPFQINPQGGVFPMPFQRGEYIGPDNEIFRGRDTGNPLFIPNNPNPNSLRRPIGSRFDPVDPFNSQGVDDPRNGNDFNGFDQFGRPFGRAPFGGPGGFGPGGFGGNFM